MNDSTDNVVWKAYLEQNELGHDIIIILPGREKKRIFALGSILAAKAPALIALMNTEVSPKEIDLSSSDLLSSSIKAVLDFVHGAHDTDPLRIALTQDYAALCSTLHAADYCGAQACKLWVENIIIKDHISNLEPNELRRLTENARACHADSLYQAAGEELAKRAPVDVLRNASSDVLAEIVDRHVEKRQRRIQELAIGSANGKLLIYDSATGSSLRIIDAHSDIIRCVAYSFDGSMVATSSSDDTARLWNAITYECLHTLYHDHEVFNVAFSNLNRSVVASCTFSGLCKIWNISNGDCLKTIESSVFTVAWSPSNETQLATVNNRTYDYKICIWNIDTSDCRELEGHQDDIHSIAYSPDGITLVSASKDRTCRLWNVANGTQLRVFTGSARFTCVEFSPSDGTSFASVGEDDTIRIWHGYTGSCIREIRSTFEYTIFTSGLLAYSPDGTALACALIINGTEKIGLFDVKTTECIRTISITADAYYLDSLAFRPLLPPEVSSST